MYKKIYLVYYYLLFREIYLKSYNGSILRNVETLDTATDILNKKIYLVYYYLLFREIYLKNKATMAASSVM